MVDMLGLVASDNDTQDRSGSSIAVLAMRPASESSDVKPIAVVR